MVATEDPCQELHMRLVRSFLDLSVLNVLANEPLWGYKLMTVLREKYGVKVGPAVIYPLLDSMESEGLVEPKEAYDGRRRRKVYHSTEKGAEYLKCFKNTLREMAG